MLLRTTILIAAAGLEFSNAHQASNFDVSSDVAEKYGCGADCQQAMTAGNAVDLKTFGRDFDFEFYDTASNFSISKPGDILKIKPVDPSTLEIARGTAVYKIQYTSEDLDGAPIPVTGFIAFPFAKASQPFNLVAFAHGTSGIYRGCAPSTSRDLYRSIEAWSPLTLSGYAVVATDYAGLGNNYTEHKYLAHASQAIDVYWSAVAAKNAFGTSLSKNWVAVGHSQGGGVVWKLSERELVQRADSGYLGGVAMAPAATRLFDFLVEALKLLQDSTNPMEYAIFGGAAQIVTAIDRAFPGYDPTWLASPLKQRFELANIGQLCVSAIGSLAMGLSLEDMVASYDVSKDTVFESFQKLNAPGQGDPASKPLLVTQGLADMEAPALPVISTFQGSCAHGNPVHLSLYPQLDHPGIISGAGPEWLQFVQDRFGNVSFDGGCTQSMAEPFQP